MIDYETTIFNDIHAIAAPLCAKNRFLSTPILSYTNLPAASLVEIDNRTVKESRGTAFTEPRARITYQLEVVAKTKSKCRSIFAAIDGRMIQINFSRLSTNVVPVPDNAEIVRMVARYSAEIDPDGMIYRTP